MLHASCFGKSAAHVHSSIHPPFAVWIFPGAGGERGDEEGTKLGERRIRHVFESCQERTGVPEFSPEEHKSDIVFFDDEAWILYSIPSTSSRPNETGAGV